MNNKLPAIGQLSPEWLDFFIVMGAMGFVLIAAFFWALFIRKGGKQRVRHRKRKHRQRDRSIAKSGGLPPVRVENPSDAPKPPP